MVSHDATRLGDADLHLFNEGSHLRLWEKLGAHPGTAGGRAGTHFAVWAPAADRVSVIGDWNGWRPDAAPLAPRSDPGIWEGFVPGVTRGARYKYHVASRYGGYQVDKADPLALFAALLWTMTWGLWNSRYWAVLGFQMLLLLEMLASAGGLIQVATIPQFVATTALLAGSAVLFYFMIRAMARIQMPKAPGL